MKIIGTTVFSLVLLGLIVWGGVGVVYNTFRFRSSEWLDSYGKEAEIYAVARLSGALPAVPASLEMHRIEVGPTFVSFSRTSSGAHSLRGMTYSTDGKMPEKVLGAEKKVAQWNHLRDNWYTLTTE